MDKVMIIRKATKHKDASTPSMIEVMMEFVRAAIFEREPIIPEKIYLDWDCLMDLSVDQGLLAWVWDGVCKLPEGQQPPRQQRINWGLSAQEIWDRYEKQRQTLMNMVDVCNRNGMKLLLLKGIGLSMLFPRPQSRPSGDIDIFLFDDFEKGNRLFAQGDVHKGIKDMGFYYEEVFIENHHKLIYTNTRQRRMANEYLLKSLSDIRLEKEGYYTLPLISNVVYLLLHTLSHMDSEYVVSLRNIIDFGMLVHKNREQLSRADSCTKVMNNLGLLKAFSLLLKLSEKYLNIKYNEFKTSNIPQTDLRRAILLVETREAKYCPKENISLYHNMKDFLRYQNQIVWLYKYAPISVFELIRRSVKETGSIIVRGLFKVPSQMSVNSFFHQYRFNHSRYKSNSSFYEGE